MRVAQASTMRGRGVLGVALALERAHLAWRAGWPNWLGGLGCVRAA